MSPAKQDSILHTICPVIFFMTVALAFGCQKLDPVRLVAIILEPVDSFTYTSCFAEGKIIDPGGFDSYQVGFCWSQAPADPATSDDTSPAGSINTDGTFSGGITGLQAGLAYNIKAYLRNDTNVFYSEQEQFTTTSFQKPTVTTDSIHSLWYNKATGWGTVMDNGGRIVLKRGLCWGRQAGPTILSDSVSDGGTGSGSFTCEMRGLTANTRYYVRAFAVNAEGTAYGNEINFSTEASTGTGSVTDINGNEYNTVKMGDQWWMAENMKATKYPDNTNIPNVQNNNDWSTQTILNKAYCYYDNSTANRDIYGALYTWAAVMKGANSSAANPSQVQGLCPDGWHIPSDAEWKELEMYLGMSQQEADKEGDRGTNEGGQLKETGTIHWEINTGATNSTGFTALPGGWRDYRTGQFGTLGYYSYYWTSTQSSSTEAWIRKLHGNLAKTGRSDEAKNSGYAVRCVKD